MTKQSKLRNGWRSSLNDVIRYLHGLVQRNRGRIRRFAVTTGCVGGGLYVVGLLVGNLDFMHDWKPACLALEIAGAILVAVIAPFKLVFAARNNWIAWAVLPLAIAAAWMLAGCLLESFQLANKLLSGVDRFMHVFQPLWLTALGLAFVLSLVRWCFDAIYDSWPPHMKNPGRPAGSATAANTVRLAVLDEMRFGASPSGKSRMKFSVGKSQAASNEPPRTRRPHGPDNRQR